MAVFLVRKACRIFPYITAHFRFILKYGLEPFDKDQHERFLSHSPPIGKESVRPEQPV